MEDRSRAKPKSTGYGVLAGCSVLALVYAAAHGNGLGAVASSIWLLIGGVGLVFGDA